MAKKIDTALGFDSDDKVRKLGIDYDFKKEELRDIIKSQALEQNIARSESKKLIAAWPLLKAAGLIKESDIVENYIDTPDFTKNYSMYIGYNNLVSRIKARESNLKKILKFPIMYKAGKEIMKELYNNLHKNEITETESVLPSGYSKKMQLNLDMISVMHEVCPIDNDLYNTLIEHKTQPIKNDNGILKILVLSNALSRSH